MGYIKYAETKKNINKKFHLVIKVSSIQNTYDKVKQLNYYLTKNLVI